MYTQTLHTITWNYKIVKWNTETLKASMIEFFFHSVLKHKQRSIESGFMFLESRPLST